ncbi:MAG: hypothetical protein ACRC1H_17310 [Caldilineaceae bacterium]
MPAQPGASNAAIASGDQAAVSASSEQLANLSPDQLRALAQILADMLRRDMRIEQERYRRPVPR